MTQSYIINLLILQSLSPYGAIYKPSKMLGLVKTALIEY